MRRARLLKLDGTWRTVKAQTKTWSSFRQRRYLELVAPCTAGPFRALFSAVLRSPGGSVVGRVNVQTKRLNVVVPCVYRLGP